MRLAIDAMGNDNGPAPIIAGVGEYLTMDSKSQIVLVGQEDKLKPLLHEAGLGNNNRVEVVHAVQVIEMDDKLAALREKTDNSIAKVVQLCKEGKADAMVALGNTMAAVATVRLGLKHLPGVHRAGIAVPMPSAHGVCITIDMGATINAKPRHLYTYAVMASAYSRDVIGIKDPKVGLLNVGAEEVKGSEVLREAYTMLKDAPVNFIGNVEGGDIFSGTCDVVVCDGFVGNAVLKSSEMVASSMANFLRQAVRKSGIAMLGAWLAKGAFRELKRKANYDQYGGAPLLGVNGVCIIGHGRSNPTAVKNALRVAHESVAQGVNRHIEEDLQQVKETATTSA